MTLFNEYKIDGLPILAPDAGIQITETDLDSPDSGRDESGLMHRDVLRYGVKKWELSYSSLSAEEYQYMQNLLHGKAVFEFQYGQLKTNAYCSSMGITWVNAITGQYQGLKINIIEC